MELPGPSISKGFDVKEQTSTWISHSPKPSTSFSQLDGEAFAAEPNTAHSCKPASIDYCNSERDYRKRAVGSPSYQCSNNRSRSPSREKTHVQENFDTYKDRKTRGTSRWEQKLEKREAPDSSFLNAHVTRRNSRNIDSNYRPTKAVIGASGSEIIGYKREPPNSVIIIRRLAPHLNENDILQDIIVSGLRPKDIRLIRKKRTGASRGFAFVEFSTLADAMRWMNMKQGVLKLQNQFRAIMQYCIPSESPQYSSPKKPIGDWFCIKCGCLNFKRRDSCFKCGTSQMASIVGEMGADEISKYITKTIMISNLDTLTTENSVMQVLDAHLSDKVQKICGVCIGRDPLTTISRGICYLEMKSTVDALDLHGILTSLIPPLSIDGKTVVTSYCKYHMGDQTKAYGPTNGDQLAEYTLNDVDKLAESSAGYYASNPVEYQQYFEYYKNYYTQNKTARNSFTPSEDSSMDISNAATAVAQSAIQKQCGKKSCHELAIPNGVDGKFYPNPDPTKFASEKSTGYLFDSSTHLYYDSGSGYYWNNIIQKYLYYDPDHLTYLLVPDFSSKDTDEQPLVEMTTKAPKPEKHKQLKLAKKVVKDMERWANIMNKKKETFSFQSPKESSLDLHLNDVGFSVFEKNNGGSPLIASATSNEVDAPLVATFAYEEKDLPADYLDVETLICKLCMRQFLSAEALSKHAQLSELHKKNLEAQKDNSKEEQSIAGDTYRDRAEERRMKYGDTGNVPHDRLKEEFLKSKERPHVPAAASVAEAISVENVGNRLLQKMGWKEGQGLGKFNQGSTAIIQEQQRIGTVGLGNNSACRIDSTNTYKECVKRIALARYQALTDE